VPPAARVSNFPASKDKFSRRNVVVLVHTAAPEKLRHSESSGCEQERRHEKDPPSEHARYCRRKLRDGRIVGTNWGSVLHLSKLASSNSFRSASRPPESGGQRDRDAVEIAREEVPKPHPEKVWLGNLPSRDPSARAALLTQEGVALPKSLANLDSSGSVPTIPPSLNFPAST
jgi:hypothetical protein